MRGPGGAFAERGEWAGVAATGWTWSAQFGDLDNDGFLDLYAVNGMIAAEIFGHLPGAELVEENQALRNDGSGRFVPAPEWGLGATESGRGMAFADLDLDGDLGKYSVYGCGRTGHIRNGVVRNEVWERFWRSASGCTAACRRELEELRPRGIGTAPAGALLPQNARQGGRAREAAERETASGACEAQGITAAPAGTVGAAPRQREASEELRRY